MTQVVTKFVVSITLENNERDFSVEHWKSLKGLSDHMNIESIAPIDPIVTIRWKFETNENFSKLTWSAVNNPMINQEQIQLTKKYWI